MGKFNGVSVRTVSSDDNGATYECTVSGASNSYFGICDNRGCTAIKAWNRYLYYWGWPKKSNWKDSWGNPDYRLVNGSNISQFAGTLQGRLDNRKYTWTDYVPIARNNQRQPSATITVGLEYKGTDSRFSSALQTITLYANAIPYGNINEFSVTADSGNISGDRYIRIHTTFTNPSNFHYCRLTDSNGKVLATSGEGATSLDYNMLITKDMYQTTKAFKVELFGKDNKACPGARSQSVSIEPSGVGLWLKPNQNNIVECTKSAFVNTKTKDITEIWIKINGKWCKTKK